MNAEEKAELDALCQRIVDEKDHTKFLALVTQLNELLERKEQRLQKPLASPPARMRSRDQGPQED